ncbi:hypothetical protein OKA05_28545 [Luteolibacter arcticus]|uniref:Uncharacterized protein n=1 Tax=Luteolibacter arcticus TaxID=1581411 RepID=A0ABT3GSS1_9BACT|nr:hypothetical protein [Luteolibacter arcticus]MCW1926535.1 hypothetical protein [Luteolibacter arcticus]
MNMTTPVLDVSGLARLMREKSATAYDVAGRGREVPDAVLLGKLTVLDQLAERMWLWNEMRPAEAIELRAASNELGRAFGYLKERIARLATVPAAPKPGGIANESAGAVAATGTVASTTHPNPNPHTDPEP